MATKEKTKRSLPRKSATASSGGALKKARDIPGATQALVYAVTAGRCEFRGCNKSLVEHHLTLKQGNFAQMAHIYAFSEAGPRGKARGRPRNPHELSNLVLLCPECHKQVDSDPTSFPVELLVEYKKEHEERIRLVSELRQDMRTVVLQLKSRIGGDAVEIPLTDVARAVAPRWPIRHGVIIDLTTIDDNSPKFIDLAASEIEKRVARLYEPGMEVDQVRHISLFALAPIPLLMFLGSRLSNKIPVDVHQRHRDTKDWIWKSGTARAVYGERLVRVGSDPSKVALLLSLSGTIDLARLPVEIDGAFTIIELTLQSAAPNPDFLRHPDDLTAFSTMYRNTMAGIVREHPTAAEIHVFPAVPAPIAVMCGYDLLKKAQPALVVYDYSRANGGFAHCIRIQ